MAVDVQTQLSRIATYAYGSGFAEGTHGGKGNIGLIDGHVVKFNTHSSERGGPETAVMLQSCNNLRQKLCSLASGLLTDAKLSVNDFQKEFSSIRKKLGIGEDGETIVATGLLDRKVVASVIRQIDARTRQNSFLAAKSGGYSSEGVDTQFSAVTADLYVERFMKKNGNAIDDLVNGVAEKLTATGKPGLSDANKTILRSVLERSVKALYVKNGTVTREDLTNSMSNLGIIKTLVDDGKFSMHVLTLALSLPPKDINAFLNAYRLVPDQTYGTHKRFASVASELSKLKPSEFTPENVLRLAWPDMKFPSGIKWRSGPLAAKDQNAFFKPISDLFDKTQKYTQDHPEYEKSENKNLKTKWMCNMKYGAVLDSGVLSNEAKSWLEDPSKFSFAMFPKSVFLAGDDNLSKTAEQTMDNLLPDIHRCKPDVSVLGPDGTVRYQMPQALHEEKTQKSIDPEGHGKTYHQGFMSQVADLCGTENVAQQRLILLFLSQNTQVPETLKNVSLGVSLDPPTNTRYIMKADPATGDVLVSKTTDPKLDWGLSVTVRFGKDGSQTIVDLQERKGPGELVPKDGEGNPMQPEVNMIHEQLV